MLASVRSKNASWDSFWDIILYQCGNMVGNAGFITKRWCTSSQSWFISVLWGEQRELHSGSSTSHIQSLRWLLSCHQLFAFPSLQMQIKAPCNNVIYASNVIIHIFLLRKWHINGHTLTIIESISILVPVSAWVFLRVLTASRFQQSRLLRLMNYYFLLFSLSMEAKHMCF